MFEAQKTALQCRQSRDPVQLQGCPSARNGIERQLVLPHPAQSALLVVEHSCQRLVPLEYTFLCRNEKRIAILSILQNLKGLPDSIKLRVLAFCKHTPEVSQLEAEYRLL